MVTPVLGPSHELIAADRALGPWKITHFRGFAARSNYLAADRPDWCFAAKEICRWMSKPTHNAWKALKRLCRFLNGAPRLVYSYRLQSVECIDVYTDADWAGCPKTRKSTSGGCVLFGRHAVKHWSSTQASVALSSGEAEFAGLIRGAGQGCGGWSCGRGHGPSRMEQRRERYSRAARNESEETSRRSFCKVHTQA